MPLSRHKRLTKVTTRCLKNVINEDYVQNFTVFFLMANGHLCTITAFPSPQFNVEPINLWCGDKKTVLECDCSCRLFQSPEVLPGPPFYSTHTSFGHFRKSRVGPHVYVTDLSTLIKLHWKLGPRDNKSEVESSSLNSPKRETSLCNII